jgi:energy-coupling factor transport system permease protein
MAEGLTFYYIPGQSLLHKTNVMIKIFGMVSLSLLLLSVSIFRLLLIFLLILILHGSIKSRGELKGMNPLLMIMPLIIFAGNFISLSLGENSDLLFGLITATLRALRFISILWMAHLFTGTTDPLTITPALYRIFKHIPFLPAARLCTQAGLTLAFIPLILDEMSEIREAMKARCGWSRRRPIRNLYHLGIPLIEGILTKAESLSDAMESRLYNEESTEPEISAQSLSLGPLMALLIFFTVIFLCEGLTGDSNPILLLMRFY